MYLLLFLTRRWRRRSLVTSSSCWNRRPAVSGHWWRSSSVRWAVSSRRWPLSLSTPHGRRSAYHHQRWSCHRTWYIQYRCSRYFLPVDLSTIHVFHRRFSFISVSKVNVSKSFSQLGVIPFVLKFDSLYSSKTRKYFLNVVLRDIAS